MPKVGRKQFAYTAKGRREASREAARTGKRVQGNQSYSRPKSPLIRKKTASRRLKPYQLKKRI